MLDFGYYLMDCMDGMKLIDDKSVDMILTDLPYGTTRNSWDIPIHFDEMWKQYRRITKDNAAIVLFSAQPFTTDLINSNREWFRYDLVWDKVLSSGFLNANRMPLRRHESILIFYNKPPKYNPIMEIRGIPRKKGGKYDITADGNTCYGDYKSIQSKNNEYYPTSILQFSNGNRNDGRVHSTQKPVNLLEYLIMTYTDSGDLVLDSCCGSCSTGVACYNVGRKFIGFEKYEEIYKVGKERFDRETAQMNLFDFIGN